MKAKPKDIYLSDPALLSQLAAPQAEDYYCPQPSTATITSWLTSSGQVSIKMFRINLWELMTVSPQ